MQLGFNPHGYLFIDFTWIVSFPKNSKALNLHPLNASSPMLAAIDGTIKLPIKLEHPLNADEPIYDMLPESAKLMLHRDMHPKNALSPILVMSPNASTFFNAKHPANVLCPIAEMLDGKAISSSDMHLLNAPASTVMSQFAGIDIALSWPHLLKAYLPILHIELGNLIDVN